VEREFAVYG
jgi:hypothetical protein